MRPVRLSPGDDPVDPPLDFDLTRTAVQTGRQMPLFGTGNG